MRVFAYNDPKQFAISFTIYDHQKNVKQRKFFLRNLEGDTTEQQVEHAVIIANDVAKELRYLTGFGIDKATITQGKNRFKRLIYPELQPLVSNELLRNSLKITITFSDVSVYKWLKGKQERWSLDDEKEKIHEWTKQERPSHETKRFSFPSLLNREYGFFSAFRSLKDVRQEAFDRTDPLFRRFIQRFLPEGNLCFGDRRCWGRQGNNWISWNYWPEARKLPKSSKYPKTTILASQAHDTTDYVYIIQSGRSTICKIGKSNDPKGRLDSLQTANPHKLRLAHTFMCDNASAAEESLHHVLQEYRLEGEWFEISRQHLTTLCQIDKFHDQQFWVDIHAYSPSSLFEGIENV